MTKRSLLLCTVVIGVLALAGSALARPGHSTSDVYFFADPATPVGTSNLIRADQGVVADFHSSGLEPGHTLTMWWVVFNEPDDCSDGVCGEDDIFVIEDGAIVGLNWDGIAAADIVVGYAAGTVVDATGRATMAAQLKEGGAVREVLFGTLPVLKDAARSEVHLVGRSHGPAVPGSVDDQIGSFAGGCVDFFDPPVIPAAVGECADVQFAVHLP